jgi:hypothetical protein
VAATRAAVVKEAADVAVAKEAAEEAVKKKAIKEVAARKMTAEEVSGKKKVTKELAGKKAADETTTKKKALEEEEAKKTESGAATAGFGPSPALSGESRGRLHPVALHLWPSCDSMAPGRLGMLCDPSSAISCTTSIILI